MTPNLIGGFEKIRLLFQMLIKFAHDNAYRIQFPQISPAAFDSFLSHFTTCSFFSYKQEFLLSDNRTVIERSVEGRCEYGLRRE